MGTRRGSRAAMAVAVLVLAGHGAMAGGAPIGPVEPLRVVSFDMSAAPGLSENRPKAPEKPSWRTSFGSEIRQKVQRTVPDLNLDADVVLLQGVTSMREARRVFPAREWKLIVSRQLIGRDDPLDPWAREAASDTPVTAVAVRYQQGLKVTGQDHLYLSSTLHNDVPEGQASPAATAVRVSVDGNVMWVVSAVLPEDCRTGSQECEAWRSLQDWQSKRREENVVTLVGGRLQIPSGGASRCAGHVIEADAVDKQSVSVQSVTVESPVAGCLTSVDWPRDVPSFMTVQ